MQKSKLQFKIQKLKIIILFSIFYFLFSSPVFAAVLYLEPSTGIYYQNDVFLVEIRLDTEGEIINAVEINFAYPREILEFEDFSKGNSILSLWVKEPNLAEDSPLPGLVSFSGGVPGGYWGKDGLLGRLIFKVREDLGRFDLLFLDNSRVLLNDGLGTLADLNKIEANFEILAGEGEGKNEWQEEIDKDKILPEPFKIELGQSPDVFDGKYFIIFSTTDKQTGLDHYEIKEGRGKWTKANSPYVLKNQKLTSDISVKAIDKAGNFWMETLKAPNKAEKQWENYLILGLSLVALVLIFAIIKIIRKKKKKTI